MKEAKVKQTLTQKPVRLSEDKITIFEIHQNELLGYIGALEALKGKRRTKKIQADIMLYLNEIEKYSRALNEHARKAIQQNGLLDVTVH